MTKKSQLCINTLMIDLRKTVKKLMVEHDLDGGRKKLARSIGVNYSSLCMALTGYRTGQASVDILTKLQKYIESLAEK